MFNSTLQTLDTKMNSVIKIIDKTNIVSLFFINLISANTV